VQCPTISHELHLLQSSGYKQGPHVRWHALLPGCKSNWVSPSQRQHLFSHDSCSVILDQPSEGYVYISEIMIISVFVINYKQIGENAYELEEMHIC
jgi:hypothetical protein